VTDVLFFEKLKLANKLPTEICIKACLVRDIILGFKAEPSNNNKSDIGLYEGKDN
jgi:hypothetical protein